MHSVSVPGAIITLIHQALVEKSALMETAPVRGKYV